MLVVSGCISPDRVRCEDGSFCPSGTRCGEPTVGIKIVVA